LYAAAPATPADLVGGQLDGFLGIGCLAQLLAGGQAVFQLRLGGRQVEGDHLFHALHGLAGQGVEGFKLEFKQRFGGVGKLLGIREHTVSSW
jgi:hypothetical protein